MPRHKTPKQRKEAFLFLVDAADATAAGRPNFSSSERDIQDRVEGIWGQKALQRLWDEITGRMRIIKKGVLPDDMKSFIQTHNYLFLNNKEYGPARRAYLEKKSNQYYKNRYNKSREEKMEAREARRETTRRKRNDEEKRRHQEVPIQNGTTKRRRGKGGLPFLHEMPQPVFEDQNAKGKFQQPVLQPGELKPMKLLDSMDDFYPEQVAEIGLPKHFATNVLDEIYHKGHVGEKLASFLGPKRCSNQDRPKGRNLPFDKTPGWVFKRAKQETGSVETDQTFVYPKDRAALKAFLETLCKEGLGDILKGIPGFLDLESRNMVVTEAFLFGVSYKRDQCSDESESDEVDPPVTHIDMDAGEGCHMGTLLIPLELPNCKIAPLVVKPEDECYDYCYRPDAALFFKAGFHHATNIFGSCARSRIMLSLHIGDYTPSDSLESLGRKSFKMKAAESVNTKPSKEKLTTWKENNQIEVDENGRAQVKILDV